MSHACSSVLSRFLVSPPRFLGRGARATAQRVDRVRPANEPRRFSPRRLSARTTLARLSPSGSPGRSTLEMLRSSKHGASNSPRMSASGDDDGRPSFDGDGPASTRRAPPLRPASSVRHQESDPRRLASPPGSAFCVPRDRRAALRLGHRRPPPARWRTSWSPVHERHGLVQLSIPSSTGLVVSASLAGALTASARGRRFPRRRARQQARAPARGGVVLLRGRRRRHRASRPRSKVLVVGPVRVRAGHRVRHARRAPMYLAETAPSSVRGLAHLPQGGLHRRRHPPRLPRQLHAIVGQEGGWRTLLVLLDRRSSPPRSPSGMATLTSGLAAVARADRAARTTRFATALSRRPRGQLGDVGDAFEAGGPKAMTTSSQSGDGHRRRRRRSCSRSGTSAPCTSASPSCSSSRSPASPPCCTTPSRCSKAPGYDSESGRRRVSVILGSFKLLMTGFAVKYVDTLGRRPLLLGGVAAS